jgi:hypothetical protein
MNMQDSPCLELGFEQNPNPIMFPDNATIRNYAVFLSRLDARSPTDNPSLSGENILVSGQALTIPPSQVRILTMLSAKDNPFLSGEGIYYRVFSMRSATDNPFLSDENISIRSATDNRSLSGEEMRAATDNPSLSGEDILLCGQPQTIPPSQVRIFYYAFSHRQSLPLR